MLKNISPLLGPELLKTLAEMGHGDEIVLGDGNFPAASMAQRLLRADGHHVPELLIAILRLLPLDTFVEHPATLMSVVPGHNYQPKIWDEYRNIIIASGEPFTDFEYRDRFAFYERAKKAYAIVATGESALYANIILKKGVVTG
jgi:L-fucose mutarotase